MKEPPSCNARFLSGCPDCAKQVLRYQPTVYSSRR